MNKTILNLTRKLEVSDAGIIQGGFISIKGGTTSVARLSQNETSCDNKNTCSGTNGDLCTNGVDCTGTTNNPEGCNNVKTCFSF